LAASFLHLPYIFAQVVSATALLKRTSTKLFQSLDPSTAWPSKQTGSKFDICPFGFAVIVDAINRSFGFVNFKNLSDAVRAKREMEGKPLATSVKLSIQFTKVIYPALLTAFYYFSTPPPHAPHPTLPHPLLPSPFTF
jgi:hypothetical protein